MELNGMKLPLAVALGALTFAMGYGSLSTRVSANEDALAEHKDKPAHTTTVADVATIKAGVSYNKENIEEVKEGLKQLDAKREADKQEILQAIRDKE